MPPEQITLNHPDSHVVDPLSDTPKDLAKKIGDKMKGFRAALKELSIEKHPTQENKDS